jgi:MFS family permease
LRPKIRTSDNRSGSGGLGGHPAQRSTGARTLFTLEFLSLNLAVFFGFCNLAIFYGFYSYLGRIGIPAEWRGFLVGLEPMTAFVVRLALIPLLHTGNSFRVMVSSLALILAALCGYQFADSVAVLIVLRVLHGAGFVLLVSAATVLLVGLIPEGCSGQAFAVMSIAWLVPYAVIPPVFGALLSHFGNEAELYARFAVLIVPGVMVLFAARRRVEKGLAGCASRKPPLSDCLLALRRRPSRLILAIGFTLFFSNTTVFFFTQEFFTRSRYGQAGPFFALSTGAVIATRIVLGKLLDKVEKGKLLWAFLPPFAACLLLLGRAGSPLGLYFLAAVFGICLGVLFPVLNAAMFLVSPPHLRGANTNVMQLVMDFGYFLSPPVAGALLARGFAFGRLFDLCALLVACAVIPLVFLRGAIPGRSQTERST